MTGSLSQILMAVSFLVNLAAIGSLWWAAHRSATARAFWRALAAGWTLGLLGNVAWIVYDLATGARLPPLSWVDIFYVARYVLVGLALWQYPVTWPKGRALVLASIVLAAAAILWVAYYRPVWAPTEQPVAQMIGVAIYPLLDVGLVFCGWARVRETRDRVRQTVCLISLAMTAYGVANLYNFWVRMRSHGESPWTTVFWMTCDILAIAAIANHMRSA